MAKPWKTLDTAQETLPIEKGLTMNGLEGWLWDAACPIRGAAPASPEGR